MPEGVSEMKGESMSGGGSQGGVGGGEEGSAKGGN